MTKREKDEILLNNETETDDTMMNSEVDMESELELIMSEIGTGESGEYNMKVFRVPVKGGRKAWLFDCDPQFSILDKLRDEYGGGYFELKVYKRNVCLKSPRITIEPPIKKKEGKENEGHYNEIAELLKKQHDSMMLTFATMGNTSVSNQGETKPQVDVVTQMTELMTLLSTMKDFNKSDAPEKTEKLSLIDQLKDLNEIKKMFSGGDGNGETSNADIMISLLENIGKPLGDHLAANAKEKQISPAVTKPVVVKQNSGDEMMFKMGVQMLLDAAMKNSDPAIYVDLILDKFSSEQVAKYLVNEDALQRIINLNPGVAAQKDWFIELISLINAQLQPDKPADQAEKTVIPITS